MASTQTASRLGPYVERLLDNAYAQEQLREAAASLRAAYERASKRRVEPTRDEKLRRQLRDAARSIAEAGQALKSGRRKPKKRRGRRVLLVVGAGVLGAAVAVALSEQLRNKLLGSDSSMAVSGDGVPSEGAPPRA
jgi:thiamine pyrophosphate-dependent acetolactate synthase large subunit-like protein